MNLVGMVTKTGLQVLKSQITKTVITTLVGALVQVKTGEAYDKFIIKSDTPVVEV